MSFLPKDYEPQQSGGRYLRLKAGKNQFRPIGRAIIGLEGWQTNGEGKRQPIRRRMDADGHAVPPFASGETDPAEKIKEFIAFPVIDRADGGIKIIQLTQAGIKGSIASLASSEDWGDPSDPQTGYDFLVERRGAGLDTEYSTMPAKAKPLTAAEQQAIAATSINLDAIYDGGDPFAASDGPKATAKPTAKPLPIAEFIVASIAQVKWSDPKDPARKAYTVTSTDGVNYGLVIGDGPEESMKLTELQSSAKFNAMIRVTCKDGKTGPIITDVVQPEQVGMEADENIPFHHGFHVSNI